MADRGVVADGSRTILIEFGRLSDEQQELVDHHAARALGGEQPRVQSEGQLIEFWVRDGDSAEATYDDIRGWARGNGLPIRRLVSA